MKKSLKRDEQGDRIRECRPHPWARLESIILRFFVWISLKRAGRFPGEVNQVFEKLQKPILATADRWFKRRGAKNHDNDCDAVQMWIVDMLEDDGIEWYDFKEPVHRFAYRTLRYHCRTIVMERLGGLRRYDPPFTDSPSRRAEADALRDAVREGLQQLPEQVQRTMITRYLLELPAKKAARLMNMPTKEFNRLTAQGRAKLRGHMEQWPEFCGRNTAPRRSKRGTASDRGEPSPNSPWFSYVLRRTVYPE